MNVLVFAAALLVCVVLLLPELFDGYYWCAYRWQTWRDRRNSRRGWGR